VRRWFNAATLARPGTRGGRVVAVGDPARPELQALVRWDPAGFAQREIAERQEAHLPPASRVATLTGAPDLLEGALATLQLPPGAEVLGPVEVADDQRYVIRVPRTVGAELSAALVLMQAGRSARKEPHLRVDVDPVSLD
jgi:primosomal protein N' (replication factor Y)